MIPLVVALALMVVVLAAALAYRSRPLKPLRAAPRTRRILLPFTGESIDSTVLDAAIRIARAEGSTLVPAYLLIVPLQYSEDSPLTHEVGVAMPLLEAVEHAALRAGVPVDARIEKGRSPTHALGRLWKVEQFDRVVAPAPAENHHGFSPKDITWILTHAPAETLILRPGPDPARGRTALSSRATPAGPDRGSISTRSRLRTAEPTMRHALAILAGTASSLQRRNASAKLPN